MFDELEADALGELMNVAVGRAAVAFSRMVGQPVTMSVPVVQMLAREAALEALGADGGSPLVAVGEQFSGAFSGSALLVFPETRSLQLVQAIVGDQTSLDELVELAEEAMNEVGNVILNSCLSGIANMLGCRIETTLPSCYQGGGQQIFNRTMRDLPDGRVLFMSIDFWIRERDMRGYIVLLLDVDAVANLRQAVAGYAALLVSAAADTPAAAAD